MRTFAAISLLFLCATIGGVSPNSQAAEKTKPPLTLLKFEAVWCGPCKVMKGVVNRVSNNFGKQVIVKTIDIDKSPELAKKYRVKSVPTIIAVKKGRTSGRLTGFHTEAELSKFVKKKL